MTCAVLFQPMTLFESPGENTVSIEFMASILPPLQYIYIRHAFTAVLLVMLLFP